MPCGYSDDSQKKCWTHGAKTARMRAIKSSEATVTLVTLFFACNYMSPNSH